MAFINGVTDVYGFYNSGWPHDPHLPSPPNPQKVKAFVLACILWKHEQERRAARQHGV